MEYYEAKFLCQNILEKEIKKLGLDIKPYTFGRLSYFNENYFKKEFKYHLVVMDSLYQYTLKEKVSSFIKAMSISMLPFSYNGFYRNSTDSLVIFLNEIGVPILNNDVTNLLRIIYHELYHAQDLKNKRDKFANDYNNFSCDLEKFLSKHNIRTSFKYLYSHDSFMIEILANKYGVQKAEQYINNNPNAYNYNLKKLDKMKQKYNKQYENYNLSKKLEIIIKNYTQCLKCKDFDKSIFETFLNDDGTFKDIKASLLDERIKQVDTKILNELFNTNSFIKELRNQNINFVETVEKESIKKR